MSLVGLTKEQIQKALANKDRGELIQIIASMATCELMYSPKEVARRRGMSKHTILKLIKEGRLSAHKFGNSTTRIPASAITEWDAKTKV